ncbi:MAG: hypothetical protein H6719_13315 [Sandaracinaceae bacterium]|nr:hypothetical protein [Sandaracinaceae bacterium]
MNEHSQQPRHGNHGTIMRNLLLSLIVLGLGGLWVAGCAEPGPDIDRTQTNLVDKSIFQGDWWHTRAVLELDDDAAWAISQAGAGAPWPGAMANYDIASNSGVMGRIRWVIDENFLYAYRAHEIVVGAADDPSASDYLGQPLAIYAIEGHVDVRYEYNSGTGERTNVISESSDRRWYDRQYMRVDWSTNLVSFGLFGAGLELDEYFGTFRREPVGNFIQEGGDTRIPASWRPQFVRIGDDRETYRFASEWPAEMDDTVHYMSFVTQEIWTPNNCFGDACNSSIRLTMRNSFLRVPPNHEYAVETLANSEYDRFGIIRTEQRTFIRGGRDRDTIGAYCDGAAVARCNFDEECGAGGACDIAAGRCTAGVLEDIDDCGAGNAANYATGRCENDVDAVCGGAACDMGTHLCQGGLTRYRGETDFLTFYRLRHNFYSDSLQNDRPCVADWQCDNRYGTVAGADPAMTDGSVCDTAAGLCTIPIRQRPVRAVDYRLSSGFPTYLVRSAFQVISDWNQTFMTGNRAVHGDAAPSGARVACQGVDMGQYCYCGAVNAPEVGADGTCAHRSDMFVEPSARGEENPFDCWVAIVGADGTPRAETEAENPSHPTSYSDYPEDVYRYAFVGSECMFRLNVNSCDVPVAEGGERAACEEFGDLRYQFFNYTSAAGAGWCGVMQPLQDPTNGEAISIPVNMGGLCLDNIATRALDLYPVLRGEVGEDSLYTGENMRGYFANTGNVHVPVGFAPSLDGSEHAPDDLGRPAGMLPTDLNAHLNDVFASLEPRLENLRGGIDGEGRSQIFSDRLRNLQGTSLERRLVGGLGLEGFDAVRSENPLLANNMTERGERLDSEAMLDRISPFRDGFQDLIQAEHIQENVFADNYIYMPREAIFTSRYNQWWAEASRGLTQGELGMRTRQLWLRAVMLHEVGHGVGLEHNFAGSFDRNNYSDGYFNIATQTDAAGDLVNALPVLDNYDCGADGLCPGDAGYTARDAGERDNNITDIEVSRWAADLRRIREARSRAGAGNTMTSSLMDYNGDYSDLSGLGHYDHAAVYYNYFNLVEAFEGDPSFREGVGTSLETLERSDITPRTLWTWYRGGDACNVSDDCPMAAGNQALTGDQGIHQRCIRNPRYTGIPVPCDGDRNCICSNFDEDFIDFVEGAEPTFNWDADGDGAPDYEPTDYMFCSNSRLGDISWCNVYDAGESFQETIDHMRQQWTEAYPRSYFRNYRQGFSTGSRALRSIIDAAKIYQHLFFRYFYEPEFRREIGPLGFNDQYLASIDAMNWLAELAQMPDVGSYHREQVAGPETCHPTNPDAPGNDAACRYGYVHMGEEMDMPGSDVSLAPGEGFYHWSRYQDGLYGFFRMERAGVFWDKLVALQALTVRDWGLSFTIDERYFINFYDLFPIEMTELFGAYVTDDDANRAPRLEVVGGEPQISYVNLLRGNCRSATTGAFEPCNGPVEERFPGTPIMGTSNEILRLYASIFALSEFPVYYDPSFESRLAVFKLGSADGFVIPDVRLDGQPTQAFGQAVPGSGHALTTDPVEADYIIYVSDRLHQPYVAVKVTERLTFNLEEEQIGFELLLRLHNTQEEVRDLEARGTLTVAERAHLVELRRQLTAGESFLEALIEVQQIFGITSYL